MYSFLHSPYSLFLSFEWQKYTLGAQAVRKIPKEYVIIEMYTTSRKGVNLNRPDVDINGERYWPVKIKHKSAGRTKLVNLHEDEHTVRALAKKLWLWKTQQGQIVEKLLL